MITIAGANMHVLHGLSWNGYSALELINQGREVIGLSLATEQTQALSHGNGTKPGGLLSAEGTLKTEQIDRIKEQFASNFSGVNNAFKTLVLDGGMKWTPFQMSGVDGQHLETRRFQVEEVARLFGISPIMIGVTDKATTYASAESFFGQYVGTTLMRWVARWEQAMLRDLIPEERVQLGVEAKFDLNSLLRGNADERASFYESAISRAGWMSRNEARRLEDLDPLPGLDEILPPAGSTAPSAAAPPPSKKPPPAGQQP
jgi:HK97 family phage portal protein